MASALKYTSKIKIYIHLKSVSRDIVVYIHVYIIITPQTVTLYLVKCWYIFVTSNCYIGVIANFIGFHDVTSTVNGDVIYWRVLYFIVFFSTECGRKSTVCDKFVIRFSTDPFRTNQRGWVKSIGDSAFSLPPPPKVFTNPLRFFFKLFSVCDLGTFIADYLYVFRVYSLFNVEGWMVNYICSFLCHLISN